MNDVTEQISAIIHTEVELEDTIKQLIAESVAFSDISVQGSPHQLKNTYGVSFINPEIIQHSKNPRKKEAFLNDDFGWLLSFSFSIPFTACIILGIFIIGDVRSNSDNLFFGALGALVGAVVGFFVAYAIKKFHDRRLMKQEKQGGFVIWVTTHSARQHKQVLKILKQHHPDNIEIN